MDNFLRTNDQITSRVLQTQHLAFHSVYVVLLSKLSSGMEWQHDTNCDQRSHNHQQFQGGPARSLSSQVQLSRGQSSCTQSLLKYIGHWFFLLIIITLEDDGCLNLKIKTIDYKLYTTFYRKKHQNSYLQVQKFPFAAKSPEKIPFSCMKKLLYFKHFIYEFRN